MYQDNIFASIPLVRGKALQRIALSLERISAAMNEPPPAEKKSDTLDPQQYLKLVDDLDVTERHKLLWAAPKAIRSAEETGGPAIDEMRVEANIAWLFAHDREWDEIVAAGARLFGRQNLHYLERRAEESPNAIARAWYRAASWLAERRVERASQAVDAFLYVAEIAAREGESAQAFMMVRFGLFSAYRLAAAAKRLDEVRERVVHLAMGAPKPFALIRLQLLDTLVGDKKAQREVFAAVRPVAEELLDTLCSYDADELRRIAELGKRIDAKLGDANERRWDFLLGAALKRFIPSRPEGMVRATVAQQAAAAFQRAGDEKAAKEMRQLSTEEFAKQKWVTVSSEDVAGGQQSLDDQAREWIDYARILFRKAFESDGPLGAIALLAAGPNIVPDVTKINAAIEQSRREGIGVFESLVRSYEVSGEGRIIGHSGPGDTAERRSFLRTYEIHVTYEADLAVYAFAMELVASGDVTLDDLMAFLSKSWIGRREGNAPGEELILSLLRPALRGWVDIYTQTRPADDRVLIVDSLAIRSETAVRKMARLIGVPDIRTVERSAGLVDEYKGLELLDDERIASVVGADLLELVRFTLDREGEGLRDRIAHGAGTAADYSLPTLDRMVLVLLRLSAIDIPASYESAPRDAST